MPTIRVTRPFTLALSDGSRRQFYIGDYDVDNAIANSPEVKAFAQPAPEEDETIVDPAVEAEQAVQDAVDPPAEPVQVFEGN